jgi:hypothetical protein
MYETRCGIYLDFHKYPSGFPPLLSGQHTTTIPTVDFVSQVSSSSPLLTMSHVKSIAIVGASGQAGTPILNALISTQGFTLTAITRAESSSTFPSSVKVRKGDYTSDSFLESAVQGQDVLIILLAPMAPKDLQSRFITAAAKTGVPWVLPCEFGPDTGNPNMSQGVPILASKKGYRDQIETLGKSSWIGLICGLWFDFVRHLVLCY